MSSRDFSEQIKALEEEGSKLLAATQLLSESFQNETSSRKSDSKSASQLSSASDNQPKDKLDIIALADISAEQKTIEELRSQLDSHAHHTEKFQDYLQSKSVTGRDAVSVAKNNLDLPLTQSGDHERYLNGEELTRKTFKAPELASTSENPLVTASSSHKQFLQYEIDSLKARLKEVLLLADQQKQQFRHTIDDLRRQLEQSLASKDGLLAQNRRELNSKDVTINRLQDTIGQLERANHLQEDTLVDMNERLVSLQKDQNELDTSMSKLKSILYSHMGNHGKSLYDRQTTNPTFHTIVHCLEQCLQDYENAVHDRDERIHALTLDVENVKLSVNWKYDEQATEYEAKIKHIKHDAAKEIENLKGQLARVNDHCTSLEDRLSVTETDTTQQAKTKSDQILALQLNLAQLEKERQAERVSWAEKEKALNNMALIAVAYNKTLSQKEIDDLKKGGQILKASAESSRTQMEDAQCQLATLVKEMDTYKSKLSEAEKARAAAQDAERQARSEILYLQKQVERKEHDLQEQKDEIVKFKKDSEVKLEKAVSAYEQDARSHFDQEVESLKQHLSDMKERSYQLQMDLSVTKTEHKNLLERYQETKACLEKLSSELNKTHVDFSSSQMSIMDKAKEIEYLKEQLSKNQDELAAKDSELKRTEYFYEERLMSKDKEIALLQEFQKDNVSATEREIQKAKDKFNMELNTMMKEKKQLDALHSKLQKGLIDKEEEITNLQDKIRKLEDVMTDKSKTREYYMNEIKDLQNMLFEKDSEMHKRREEYNAMLSSRETQFRQLEEQNFQLSKHSADAQKELETLKIAFESKDHEIKSARFEVAKLQEQNEALQSQIEEKQGNLGRELARLTNKLHAAQHEARLAKKALKTKEHYETKAVNIAEDMQKEVTEKRSQIDAMRSRIRWLEECLDSALKEKSSLSGESQKFVDDMTKLQDKIEEQRQQITVYEKKCAEYQQKVSSLEAALEKAAMKNAFAHSAVEQHEQELARLQLRHQLQLKEIKRSEEKLSCATSAPSTSSLGKPVGRKSSTLTRMLSSTKNLAFMSTQQTGIDRSGITKNKSKLSRHKELGTLPNYAENFLRKVHRGSSGSSSDYTPSQDKPDSEEERSLPAPHESLAADLKNLLSEMKNLVQIQRYRSKELKNNSGAEADLEPKQWSGTTAEKDVTSHMSSPASYSRSSLGKPSPVAMPASVVTSHYKEEEPRRTDSKPLPYSRPALGFKSTRSDSPSSKTTLGQSQTMGQSSVFGSSKYVPQSSYQSNMKTSDYIPSKEPMKAYPPMNLSKYFPGSLVNSTDFSVSSNATYRASQQSGGLALPFSGSSGFTPMSQGTIATDMEYSMSGGGIYKPGMQGTTDYPAMGFSTQEKRAVERDYAMTSGDYSAPQHARSHSMPPVCHHHHHHQETKTNNNANNANSGAEAPYTMSHGSKQQRYKSKRSADVCKRLKQKIDKLSHIGEQLQNDNEDFAQVMQQEAAKLADLKVQLH